MPQSAISPESFCVVVVSRELRGRRGTRRGRPSSGGGRLGMLTILRDPLNVRACPMLGHSTVPGIGGMKVVPTAWRRTAGLLVVVKVARIASPQVVVIMRVSLGRGSAQWGAGALSRGRRETSLGARACVEGRNIINLLTSLGYERMNQP
jgi:hypothetical protein